jgi:hypothetical protein
MEDFEQWLNDLDLQTLTDELKEEILERVYMLYNNAQEPRTMKKETLEEAAEHFIQGFGEYNTPKQSFIAGAKWQQEQTKEMEKKQKIEMLKSFLHDLQMGEDVEGVEAWFKQYEKQKENTNEQ